MDKACAAFWVAPLSIFISGSHLFDYMRANYAMDPKAFRCAPCLHLLQALLCHELITFAGQPLYPLHRTGRRQMCLLLSTVGEQHCSSPCRNAVTNLWESYILLVRPLNTQPAA